MEGEHLGARFFTLEFPIDWITEFISKNSVVVAEVSKIREIPRILFEIIFQEAYALSCRLLGLGFPLTRVRRLITKNPLVHLDVCAVSVFVTHDCVESMRNI